jgi:hypothetical protein
MHSPGVKLALLLLVSFAAGSGAVRADCACVCVDGMNRPLCSDSRDVVPVCPPRVCADEPRTTRPLDAPALPPTGTEACSMQYLYNKYTRRYEWRQLCR